MDIFIYDFYVELRQIHNLVRNILCHIEKGVIEGIALSSIDLSDKITSIESDTRETKFMASELLFSFEKRYYPVSKSSGETLQKVIQTKWGTKEEINLFDFTHPLITKCKELENQVRDIHQKLHVIASVDNLSLKKQVSIHHSMECIDELCEMITTFYEWIEGISPEEKKITLIWSNCFYSPPSYI